MKTTIKLIPAFLILFLLNSCGGKEPATTEQETTQQDQAQQKVNDPASYDPHRGEGKYTAELLALTDKLDPAMSKSGEDLTNVKCSSCHKMTDEKLVGPGWKGVTQRRTPEWIMNFITNPDPMLEKDPAAQAMLEICLVRMPNQNLSDKEARDILEYMRQIDGVK